MIEIFKVGDLVRYKTKSDVDVLLTVHGFSNDSAPMMELSNIEKFPYAPEENNNHSNIFIICTYFNSLSRTFTRIPFRADELEHIK